MSDPKPAVFLAVPAYQGREEEHHMKMTVALSALQKAGYRAVEFGVPKCSFVGWARDLAAHVFLRRFDGKTDGLPACDPLVFVDSDVGFEAQTLLRLLALSERHPLLAVACPKKELHWKNLRAGQLGNLNLAPEYLAADFVVHLDPRKPLAIDEEGLVSVRSAGTGLMVVRRKVFEAIEAAGADRFAPDGYWYKSGANPQTLGEQIFAFFHFRIRWDGEDKVHHYDSEDFSFCNRWRALGGEVKILADADVSHTGTHTFRGNLQKTLAIQGRASMPKGKP